MRGKETSLITPPQPPSSYTSVDCIHFFQFDWYCTTLDGGSCPAFEISDKNEVKGRGKETSSIMPTLTTLEAVINKENLRKAELIIDGDLLLPGEYIFTLAAAKG